MAFAPTAEQRAAIDSEGGRLLVSAAAGSGKTKVLVERLLRKVDAGEDIDRFLVITFTNAAAAELRARIMDVLFDRVAANPADLRLRRQAQLLGRAHIETIHGFCASLLREYAHKLRLPRDFRVADEKETANLADQAAADLLEEMYGRNDPDFNALADIMGAGRDDSALVEILLDTHRKLLSHPSPEKWVRRQLEALALDGVTDAGDTVWGRTLMEDTARDAAYWLSALRKVLEEAGDSEKFMKSYGDGIASAATGLETFLTALGSGGWDRAREALTGVTFPRARGGAPGFEREIAVRNACKEWAGKLSDLFWDDSQKALDDMRAVAPVLRALLETVLTFDGRFGELKRKKGVLDFSDLEHMTLKLLTDPETGAPTETAAELSGRFSEIMVDEYQDVNEIQETIFTALSKKERNIFTVGDVKQSIYRFRLADPGIFLRHYDAYADVSQAGEGQPRKAVLSRNFRSAPEILDAVNFVFENVMSRELGDIDYGPRERLYPPDGAERGAGPRVELDLISVRAPSQPGEKRRSPPPGAEDEDAPGKVEAEAVFAARRIRELIASGTVTGENGAERPVKYGDIAVLIRSPRSVQAVWEQVFAREGVPLASSQPTDLFAEYEVSLALSLLSVIDNPRQDIPLITVLRCPVYGFTAEDLARIRLCDRTGDFWAALNACARDDQRCAAFVRELQELRELSPDMTSDELLWTVYTRTGLFAVVSAMPSGQERRENLMLLMELARSCESAGYRGLFGFMTWVRRLQARGDTPETVSGGTENAVTLMSTHKSKGLEFPIVFLAGLTHRFNREDSRARLLIHPELGPGPKRLDLTRKIEYNTIARRAVSARLRRESLSEELRILYVAMTRPQQRLFLLCTYPDACAAVQKLVDLPLPVPPQLLSTMPSPAEWILAPALKRPESRPIRFGLEPEPCTVSGAAWAMRLVDPDWLRARDPAAAPVTEEEPESGEADGELAERLGYVYPYAGAVAMPSKVTATELKGNDSTAHAAEEAAYFAGTEPEPAGGAPVPPAKAPERPAFMGGRGGLTPAQRGTAAHMVMQYADYAKCGTVRGVREEIERLCRMDILTREQAEAVKPDLIAGFFASRPGRLVLGADRLHRELKFSLLVDSGEIPGFAAGEKVLLQGVVDCCVEKNGRLTVIDFKTDRVTDATLPERAGYYAGQLAVYALAVSRLFKLPVERKLLYFLTAGKTVELP